MTRSPDDSVTRFGLPRHHEPCLEIDRLYFSAMPARSPVIEWQVEHMRRRGTRLPACAFPSQERHWIVGRHRARRSCRRLDEVLDEGDDVAHLFGNQVGCRRGRVRTPDLITPRSWSRPLS